MKISKLNSNISYGYNAQYHKKLHKKLSEKKRNKELANFLIEQDKLSLKIEDELVEMEKSPKKTTSERYFDLAAYLIDTKTAIAYTIAACFENLKYCDNLIKQYLKEIKNIKNPQGVYWRRNLCKSLATYSIKKYPELEDKKKIKPETKNEETTQTATQQLTDTLKNVAQNQAQNKTQNQNIVKMPNILTLLEPSISSPMGLDDVVGLVDKKRELRESLIDYINNPQQAELDNKEYGITKPAGYLFYGPPGCGKTYITQAIAAESKCPVYKMDVSKVGSKFVNQTANNIQEVFNYLLQVSKKSPRPVLLFMDEVDSLARNRSFNQSGSGEDIKTTATLLKLLDDAKDNNIVVIAATNKFDILDEAFVNRFDGQYYFGLPDQEQIKGLLIKLLSQRTKGNKLALDSNALDEISKELTGFSNRSIVFLVNEASKNAKRNSRRDISKQDFDYVISQTDLEKINEKDFIKQSKKHNPMGFQK